MRSVRFCAEEVAAKILPNRTMAIISITNPGDRASLQDGWGEILRISFADAEYDEDAIRFFEKMWHVSARGFVTKAHALCIREFLDGLDSSISELIIHCGAGVSRSAGVAMYAANRFGCELPGDVSQHNKTVLRLLNDPCAFDSVLPAATQPSSFLERLKRLFH